MVRPLATRQPSEIVESEFCLRARELRSEIERGHAGCDHGDDDGIGLAEVIAAVCRQAGYGPGGRNFVELPVRGLLRSPTSGSIPSRRATNRQIRATLGGARAQHRYGSRQTIRHQGSRAIHQCALARTEDVSPEPANDVTDQFPAATETASNFLDRNSVLVQDQNRCQSAFKFLHVE